MSTTRKASKVVSKALAATGLAGLGLGAYQYEHDEGLRRSLFFWSRALPPFAHYRYTQIQTRNLSDEERDAAFAPLHVRYSPVAMDVLLHLKGFYIKCGQYASTFVDFFPKEYLDKLSTLQDSAPSEPYYYVASVIEQAMGKPMQDIFLEFEPQPMASASIGQVHRAVLKDGREVAVKVMYPTVERLFRGDVKNLEKWCRFAQPEHLGSIKEVEKQFATEFDYTREAKNLELMHDQIERRYHGQVVVPRCYYANKQVLIMEFLHGEHLIRAFKKNVEVIARLKGTSPEALIEEIKAKEKQGARMVGASKAEIDRWRAVIRWTDSIINSGVLLHNYLLRPLSLLYLPRLPYRRTDLPLNTAEILQQVFTIHGHEIISDGSFNGDPHPGNIMLLEDGRIGLIDFGQVKTLSHWHRIMLSRMFLALARNDKPAVVELAKAVGFRTRNMNDDVIYKIMGVVFDRDDRDVTGGLNIQEYVQNLMAEDPWDEVPDDFVLVVRASLILRGLSSALKYKLSPAATWAPIAKEFLKKNNVPENLTEEEKVQIGLNKS